MKRREQILLVGLELFNREGESNLSAVDIANELDISPGNLYYHYKGKEEIVAKLFDQFEHNVKTLLQESLSVEADTESILAVLLVLLEQIFAYRFVYRNPTDLVAKYPAIEVRFRRLISLKQNLVVAMLQHFLERGYLDADMVVLGRVEEIAENAVLVLLYYYQFCQLQQKPENQQQFVREGFKKIVTAISAYGGKAMALHISFLEEFIENQIE